jgi:hypothetical protein
MLDYIDWGLIALVVVVIATGAAIGVVIGALYSRTIDRLQGRRDEDES